LAKLLDSVQFHLDAHTWLGGNPDRSQRTALDDRLMRLSELLLDPVSLNGTQRLWIAPHAGLVQIPWAALPDGSGGHLVDRVQMTLLPGAEAAVMLLRKRARSPRSVAIGGSPSPGLPMVAQEVSELAAMTPTATVASFATRDEFLHLLETHEMVHLAGHSVFLDGLPFASGLRMTDGYVTVRDLAATRMAARFVSFGVCSGLRLGREPGERYAGFVLALMSGGVQTVVGPMTPVRDEVAYAFDMALHTGLRETSDPARAFCGAVRAVREIDPQPATWGSFHVYGDPRGWEQA
jgi:CHAT domain-containing protein